MGVISRFGSRKLDLSGRHPLTCATHGPFTVCATWGTSLLAGTAVLNCTVCFAWYLVWGEPQTLSFRSCAGRDWISWHRCTSLYRLPCFGWGLTLNPVFPVLSRPRTSTGTAVLHCTVCFVCGLGSTRNPVLGPVQAASSSPFDASRLRWPGEGGSVGKDRRREDVCGYIELGWGCSPRFKWHNWDYVYLNITAEILGIYNWLQGWRPQLPR